jgi:hypothetical protein
MQHGFPPPLQNELPYYTKEADEKSTKKRPEGRYAVHFSK